MNQETEKFEQEARFAALSRQDQFEAENFTGKPVELRNLTTDSRGRITGELVCSTGEVLEICCASIEYIREEIQNKYIHLYHTPTKIDVWCRVEIGSKKMGHIYRRETVDSLKPLLDLIK